LVGEQCIVGHILWYTCLISADHTEKEDTKPEDSLLLYFHFVYITMIKAVNIAEMWIRAAYVSLRGYPYKELAESAMPSSYN
jgi:hypothetical protein